MPGATKRSEAAGVALAEAICEMVHLMYQKQTALSFLRALTKRLHLEVMVREENVRKD